MTDTAPEMIWADPSVFPEDDPDWTCGDWTDSDLGAGSRAVLYIRADLHRTEVDALITAAEQRGYANAMEAERKIIEASLDEHHAALRAHTEAAVRRALDAAAYEIAEAAEHDAEERGWTDGAGQADAIAKRIRALDPAQFVDGAQAHTLAPDESKP
jgi:hypothetical protein